MATLQGSAPSQKQQESHVALPLQCLDLVQCVKLDEGKMRYLIILVLKITIFWVQSSALLHGI